MFKDISVLMMGTASDEALLAAAAQLSRHFQARLSPIQVVDLPELPYNTWAILPDPGITKAHDAIRQQAAQLAERAGRQLAGMQIDAAPFQRIEALYTDPWAVAAKECFCTDLIIAGRSGTGPPAQRETQGIATLILQSGRPILLLPGEAKPQGQPAKIVVAWTPTRESTRAAHDALPFLRQADSVDILALVDDSNAEENRRALPQIVAHLDRHGVKAKPVVQASLGMDIASLVLAHAKTMHAELVVAGGYGHSRFREWALGGVTRELLLTSHLPVFLSH